MDATRSLQIRGKARDLLVTGWKRRDELWPDKSISLSEFLVEAPARIATNLLRLQIKEVPEIVSRESLVRTRESAEVVGVLNRPKRKIIFAQKWGFWVSRFTLAHEIGHWLLHPSVVVHRERALDLTRTVRRSPIERDADLFAAELLMPSRLVQDAFLDRFNEVIEPSANPDAVYYWLSRDGAEINTAALYDEDPMYRAIQFATTRYYHGRWIVSMCEFFRVSPSAMAIQLIDLGLVK